MALVLIKLNHRIQLNFQQIVNWRKLRKVVFALIRMWVLLFIKFFYLRMISINKTST